MEVDEEVEVNDDESNYDNETDIKKKNNNYNKGY